MRTLTEVFTPGAPTLPEGLRTLVVSPERALEPGMTVRASFTFRNQGGATATGVRARMNMPEGLVYLVGSAQLDGHPLEGDRGNCALLSPGGADIGDVAPGEERAVAVAYSVAGAIENGTVVELQAAVAAFEIPPVGSNIARFVVRSHPVLDNALTSAAIEATSHQARPGGEAVITLRVHNAGESSAHDVVALVPIPEHTAYIANSARVNGREIETELHAPFDRVYAPVIIRTLPASATATLTYRVRIDDPIEDGTPIVVSATVGSQETAAVELPRASLTVASTPEFHDEQTFCSIEPAREIQAGERVTVRLHLHNSGTMAAQNAGVAVQLPEGLILVRGGSRLDGRPLKEKNKKDGVTLEIGRIDANAGVDLCVDAVVASPAQNGALLRPVLELQWNPGAQVRRMEPEIRILAQPFLSPSRNSIERASKTTVRPGDEVEALIALRNEGSAAATDMVLELERDPAIEDLFLLEKNAKIALVDGAAEIDRLEPNAARRFTVRGRIRSPYQDGAELKLSAVLHSLELGQTQLGAVAYRVDSHPAFSSERCTVALMSAHPLRPNEVADAYVRIVNEGTDVAHDVRLRLYISPEARLESVDGATRDKSAIVFGEIAPGASVEARLGLRLLRSLAREVPVTVEAILTATSVLPVPLQPLTIATAAEPDFSVGLLQSRPADFADAGETLEYALHVRNGGDGTAARVQVQVDSAPALIYVPNTTSVNGVPIRDVGAAAPFAAEPGIVLNDVDPGVEAVIAWREVVHNDSPAGQSIARVAHLNYEGNRHDEIWAPELKVRSAPAFANNIPGLPFGLDGMVGHSLGAGTQRALFDSGEPYLQLPPAIPISSAAHNGESAREFENPAYLSLEGGGANGHVAACIGAAIEITPEALTKSLRFLEQAQFGGLVNHLFAVRTFLATSVDARPEARGALSLLRDEARDILDRLFIKLRLPDYLITTRDVATTQLRLGLQTIISQLVQDQSDLARVAEQHARLHGGLDSHTLQQATEYLQDRAAHCAALWFAASALIVGDESAHLNDYRTALLAVIEPYVTGDERDFLDALQRGRFSDLDRALEGVKRSLYAPA